MKIYSKLKQNVSRHGVKQPAEWDGLISRACKCRDVKRQRRLTGGIMNRCQEYPESQIIINN